MTTDVEDPFDTPAPPERKILDRGRYWLPRMDGTKKPWGWMRVSNLVSAYSDQFGLRMWEIEHAFRGVAKDSALYADLTDEIARWDRMDKQGRKRAVETFLERCKTVTGGDAGSKHGNQRHHAVEAMHVDATLPDQHPDAGTRRSLSLYAAALVRNGLRAVPGMQERIVLVESLEVCGRLDNVLEDVAAGGLHIGDLKTQKRFWTWLEVAAQFACYAHADAMWDFERNQWVDMPPVSQDIGMILWMPRETEDGQPWVDVYEVDLVAGWETARRAYEVVKDRSAAKSARGPRAWLRQAAPATLTEQYAARYAALDSLEDGRALGLEAVAAGAWDATLAVVAKRAYDRLTGGLTVTQK